MIVKIFPLVGLIFAGTSLVGLADRPATGPSVLLDLKSKDLAVRAAARNRILKERRELITGLIELAKTSDDADEGVMTRYPNSPYARFLIRVRTHQ